MTDPTRISDPAVRALAREVTALRRELDTVKAGQRASQLGHSSVDDGSLWFTDAAGIKRVSIGKQVDGKFGWGAVNGDPPPRPTPPQLDGTVNGVTIGWDGQFIGAPPSDFTHVKAYLSPAGATFIPSEGNVVGHLLGNAKLPITPLDVGTSYWCVLIAYNTSGVASQPSIVAGPVQPSAVVATELLDGIVQNVNLALDAVEQANIAAGAVGETQIDDDAVQTRHVVARAIDAVRIAVETIQAENMATDSVDARVIRALSIISDHLQANIIEAGHIKTGAVTADKLEAILVLASQVIAGDPNDWHLELGDSQTPILYWNNDETGFAVSRDQVTGQANVYMSGRVEFGNGSQIEQDYLDLCEQPSTGFQSPTLRQQRMLIYSEPVTVLNPVPSWVSATARGNLLLCSVNAVNYASTGAPTLTVPAGWQLVRSHTYGATNSGRASLYYIPNSATSRTKEAISASVGCSWAVGLYEYSGIAAAALDVHTGAVGNSATAATGTTGTPAQGNELQFAVFSTVSAATPGKSGFGNPSNGYAAIAANGGNRGQGSLTAAKVVTGAVAASTTAAQASGPWAAIVATFRAAAAAPEPNTPPAGVARLYTRSRAGSTTPYALDSTGATYPLGRLPYCRVALNAGTPGNLPSGAVAPGPGFWCGETDLWAQGDWVASTDPWGMVAISTSAGTYSNITVPLPGMYLIMYKTIFQPSTSTEHVGTAYIARNQRAANSSVARDSQPFNRYGAGDWSPVHAQRLVALDANDQLFWGNWASVQSFVTNSRTNIPTEITVMYMGPTN